MALKRYAAILVHILFVDLYPVAQGVHSHAGGVLQRVATQEMTIDDGREDVARAWEMHWYLIVSKEEILILLMIIACHSVLTIHQHTRDKHRLGAYLTEAVYEQACLFLCSTFYLVFGIGEITRLGIVWEDEIGRASCRERV